MQDDKIEIALRLTWPGPVNFSTVEPTIRLTRTIPSTMSKDDIEAEIMDLQERVFVLAVRAVTDELAIMNGLLNEKDSSLSRNTRRS